MKNALYIVLGWMLGLISPWVAELTQRPYKRSQIRKPILIELKDLKAKLASVALLVAMNRGTLNAELVTWFRRIAKEDADAFKRLNDVSWEAFSRLNDDQVTALARAQTPAANVKLNFKRYSVPFLDAHLSALNLFSVQFQALAHRIRGKLQILNQEIDVTWFYFQKTFEGSLSELNRSIIQGNHEASHDYIGRLSRQIIDDIDELSRLAK